DFHVTGVQTCALPIYIKRGDIGSTARLYARGHLATPGAAGAPDARISDARIPDAVTLAGYLGENAVRPFIEAAQATGRGLYVLVRPSDPGADRVHEFAGQPAPASEARPAADTSHGASGSAMAGAATRFYQHMAALVREWGGDPALIGSGGLSCVGAVVAPKDEPSTRALRSTMPHTPWL